MASTSTSPPTGKFFLILSDAAGQRHVFPLHSNQVATIGRAQTNRITVTDDVCSRNHCEIFSTSQGWTLRDRNSRNGTYVNSERIQQDYRLKEDDVIRIGTTQILYTRDQDALLTVNLPDSESDTATEILIPEELRELPEILHRRKRSSYRDEEDPVHRNNSTSGVKLSRLYQMALKMGNTQSAQELADIALDSLVGITGSDIGAVLTRSDYAAMPVEQPHSRTDLAISSYRSLSGQEYRRVSNSLSEQVFQSGEAILARDLRTDESVYQSRDSLHEIQAESLIVAPVLDGSELYGLIHLYSTNPDNPLDADGLDYTLAVADQLAVALKNLHQRQLLQEGLKRMKKENLQLRQQLAIEHELVGKSPGMQRLRDTISLVAPTDTVVLIRGESGVGKELVARAIHLNSKRKDAPLVCMNCAALNESLLESELFGHEKGSFTGATGQKQGKFEQAHTGTLFLDEVGEMSPSIQAKFLRVMEGHPFERVGGATTIHVDVRMVAATNRNLEQAVRDMTFRKDLYFRLQVIEVHVPPLRERLEDVPLLAQFFAERSARKSGRPVTGFTPLAMEKLQQYDWPGNVRELQNTIERAVVLCAGELIDLPQIRLSNLERQYPLSPAPAPAATEPYSELSIEDLEKEHIWRTLELTQGNKSKAAQILGIERSTLDRKLKKYGLKNARES